MCGLYVTIAGTMGVGKTTVSQVLRKRLKNAFLMEEHFAENHFLTRFYDDMSRWAFHSQSFFMMEKINQNKEAVRLLQQYDVVIQDTPIMQDVFSYAKAQYIQGNMDDAEFGLYTKIYAGFVENLRQPDVIIYLEADIETLVDRLEKRNRSFEQDIPRDYLLLLDRLNKDWLKKEDHTKIMRIDTTDIDLRENSPDSDDFMQTFMHKYIHANE